MTEEGRLRALAGYDRTVREDVVQVRGESIPLTIVGEGGRDLLFLHGYARHPLDYRGLLEELARRGHRVVAPFLFANNGLRRPPTHFWACAGLARRTVEALRREQLVSPAACAFGHSTGGAVAMTLGVLREPPPRLIAVNPVQPSSRWPTTFMLASAWMNAKLGLGIAGDGVRGREVLAESGPRFYANWFKKPGASFALIGGLRAFTYERLERWYQGTPRPRVPARVLYGAGDEFYPACDGLEPGYSRTFEDFEVVRLDGENSHEWLMVRPGRAADAIEGCLPGA